MTSLPISKARDNLADLANRVALRGDRVVVVRRGKNLFAMVPIEDLELLEFMEDQADLDLIRERLGEPTKSLEQVKAQLGL